MSRRRSQRRRRRRRQQERQERRRQRIRATQEESPRATNRQLVHRGLLRPAKLDVHELHPGRLDHQSGQELGKNDVGCSRTSTTAAATATATTTTSHLIRATLQPRHRHEPALQLAQHDHHHQDTRYKEGDPVGERKMTGLSS